MHGRGCSKRHTVGCTDDLAANGEQIVNAGECGPGGPGVGLVMGSAASGGPSGVVGGGRTRRSGLLTVMERPPGK